MIALLRLWPVIASLAAGTALVGGGAVYVSHKQSHAPSSEKVKAEEAKQLSEQPSAKADISDNAPDEYYKPFPKPPAPPPLPAPVVIAPKPVASELFITQEVPRPELTAAQRMSLKLRKLREKSTGSVYTVGEEERPHSSLDILDEETQSVDKDFSEQGEPKSIPSYPVNLERVVTMDRFIPAVLYTEVKTDLQSEKVIAVVEQDIAGAHGSNILIPRGSHAIGRYKPLKKTGDRRIAIQWYRILTPQGINIRLNSEVADTEGAAGMTGEVDNRWKDKYGTAMLISSITAAAQISVPVNDEKSRAVADSFSMSFGQITAEALRQSLDIEPRLTIPKGSRIIISPLTDIWFKEPKGRVVEAVPAT